MKTIKNGKYVAEGRKFLTNPAIKTLEKRERAIHGVVAAHAAVSETSTTVRKLVTTLIFWI
jgi:hypothetical protein